MKNERNKNNKDEMIQKYIVESLYDKFKEDEKSMDMSLRKKKYLLL